MPRTSHASGTCQYCRRRVFPAGSPEVLADRNCLTTRDHVVPQIWGDPGVRARANIVIACQGCNGVKGSWPAEVFEWFRAPGVGTPLFTRPSFNKFAYGLTLAGFRAATRDALALRPPAPFVPSPPPAPAGHFTTRDLRRA